MTVIDPMRRLVAVLSARQPAMTQQLADWVAVESHTEDKAGVDALGAAIEAELAELGARVARHPQTAGGDHLVGVFNAGGGSPICLYLHMDTVYPAGTLARRPVRVEDGKLYGPGAYDMKASHVIALHAVRALQESGLTPAREIQLVFTSDEETGSRLSRRLIEDTARDAALCMVMEPALPGGSLKSSRKGTGLFKVRARGKASHAGAAHRDGVNAIQEIAHQALALQAMTDYGRGVTFSVGAVRGGGVTNVVPDWAELEVDVRVASLADRARVEGAVRALAPVLPGARLEIDGGFDRPPMECTAERLAAFERIRVIGREVGLDLSHGPSGGGSDASFTAALGAPTLDGFGAVGDGAHADDEHVVLSSLPERAALCAAILIRW